MADPNPQRDVPTTVAIRTTYRHLPDQSAVRPAALNLPDVHVMEAREPSVAFYRFLYGAVRERFTWTDRLAWTDDRLYAHLSRPEVTLLPLYLRGTPIGYVEFDAAPEEPDGPGSEIAYLGVFPAFHGRGYCKHLLSIGVARAFADGAERIWLHTCSLDGPHAIRNHLARGFLPYRTETEEEGVPATTKLVVE